MTEGFERKYRRILEILPDVASCIDGNLILVGGTALALFHLRHRVSVDLDFVPVRGDDVKLKVALKGRLTKKGYRTSAGRFKNQFVVQFEDTSIKVEVFSPDEKIRLIEEHVYGASRLKVASLDDIFRMKIAAYRDRKEARDLFDVFCVLKAAGKSTGLVKKLVAETGNPENLADIEAMATSPADAVGMRKVIEDASP